MEKSLSDKAPAGGIAWSLIAALSLLLPCASPAATDGSGEAAVCEAGPAATNTASRIVEPQPYYGKVAQKLVEALEGYHVLRRRFDDNLSRQAWTNLVSFYDFDRSIFLKGDLAAFAAHETTIDDELKSGDVGFAFDLYDLYCRRLRERVDFVTNLLATAEWDFTTNETFLVKRKQVDWPETREEAEGHWRKRLKYEMLSIIVNRELDAEDAAARTDGEEASEPSAVEQAAADAAAGVDDAGAGAEGLADAEDADPNLSPQEILLKKYRMYVSQLAAPDEETVMQAYMSAVCRAYDPHTDYFSPISKEDFDMDMSLTLCGIGATLSMDEGALKIVEILPGSPVDKDGRIHEGDRIVGVGQGDGPIEDILWQPMRKSIRKIRGPKDTRVTLELIPASDRSGATRKRYELVRDQIKLEDMAATGRVEVVERADVTNKLGYVYLPSFYGTSARLRGTDEYRSCTEDVAKYLAEFNAMGVEGVVLDLRGNGGGNLDEAVGLSSRFVPSGPVVQVYGRKFGGRVPQYPIPRDNVVSFRGPVVVLVDRASASASEIVAAHLQDTGRAVVVGDTRTHGKGTVQTMIDNLGPEKYGSAKITTSRFYRVDGRSTQVKGVESDIRLPSLLDSLDIGEDKLDGALPFTRILRASYSKCWNMDEYVERLARLSAERLRGDERYERHLACVAGTKTIFDRETVPLEKEAFKEMAKADRSFREDGERKKDGGGKDKRRGRRRRGAQGGDDVVLDETFEILADLVAMNAGAELPQPLPTALDWYNSIFGF